MKITFLLTQSLESPGSVGRYFPLAKALVRLGHKVTVIALHHNYAALKRRIFVKDGVEVRYVAQMHVKKIGNTKQYYSPMRTLLVSTLATLRLAVEALRIPADVIHVCKTQPMNGLAAWIVHKLQGTPVYLDSDDYEAAVNRFSSLWQQKMIAWFEDWMPSFAAGITVNSSELARRFENLGYPSERIIVVPNGVDRDRFNILNNPNIEEELMKLRSSLGIARKDRVIVYVGTISLTSHALGLLFDAFLRVLEKEPNALLLVVGGGEDLALIKGIVKKVNLNHRIKFTGFVDPNVVPYFYRLAEVSVDPISSNEPNARYSLSLKLVESIAAGVPCVTVDIGDRRAIVDGAGLVVPPDDSSAFAEAILELIKDQEKMQAIRATAFLKREELFWDNKVYSFEKIYRIGVDQ